MTMARFKNWIVFGACRFAMRAARRGFLPLGAALAIVGLIAGKCEKQGKNQTAGGEPEEILPPVPDIVTCYKPVPAGTLPQGPEITRVDVRPNPTGGARVLRIEANARFPIGDTTGKRVDGIYITFSDKTLPMKPADGEFDSDSEEAYLDIDISAWEKGNHGAMIWAYTEGLPPRQPETWVKHVTIEVTPKK